MTFTICDGRLCDGGDGQLMAANGVAAGALRFWVEQDREEAAWTAASTFSIPGRGSRLTLPMPAKPKKGIGP